MSNHTKSRWASKKLWLVINVSIGAEEMIGKETAGKKKPQWSNIRSKDS